MNEDDPEWLDLIRRDPEWLDLIRRDPWLDHDVTGDVHPAPRVHPVWVATVLLGMALFVMLVSIGLG